MGLLLGLILLLLTSKPVFAQSVGDLYQKTVTTGNSYRKSHDAYQVARNQHIQYNTGATRIAAFDATKKVLVDRNQWQLAYLTYIRFYLAQVSDIGNYTQTVVYLDLENEISNLNVLNSNLNSGDTVETINKNSQDWEKRLETSDKLADATVVQIISAKLATYQKDFQGFIDKSESEDTTTLNLIKQKLQASIDLRTTVDKSIANYKSGFNSKTTMQNQLTQSKQLLLEAAQLLEQISKTQ